MYVRVCMCVAKTENVVEMWIECSKLCVKFGVIITFCSDNPGHGLPLVWRDINTKSEILPILMLMAIQTNKNVSPNPQFLVWLEISSFALLIDAKSLYQNSSLPWSKSGGAQTCPETRNCRITERISLQTFSHSLNSTHISHLKNQPKSFNIFSNSSNIRFLPEPEVPAVLLKRIRGAIAALRQVNWSRNEELAYSAFSHPPFSTCLACLAFHAPNSLIYHRENAAGSKGQDFPRSPSANSIQVKATVLNLV